MSVKPPAPMAVSPWEDELAQRISRRFGPAVRELGSYVDQPFCIAEPAAVADLIAYLKSEEDFDFLVDITAVDYPNHEPRFELVYVLYSFRHNRRIRVKTLIGQALPALSITSIFDGANWLEREVYDMFGIAFAGHPALTRILLPDDWTGFPLRKDYGITQMDRKWVRDHLDIESGQ